MGFIGGKLESLFGQDISASFSNEIVVDYGCGESKEAITIAKNGVKRVIGIDIHKERLDIASLAAEDGGVDNICSSRA